MLKLESLIKAADQFGVPLELRITEDRKYKTLLGGITSILIYTTGFAYALMAFYSWGNGGYLPSIQEKTQTIDSDVKYDFTFNPVKFELARIFGDNPIKENMFFGTEKTYFLSTVNRFEGLNPQSTGYLPKHQKDCLKSKFVNQSDSLCLDITQQPNSISISQHQAAQNIGIGIYTCQQLAPNQSFCQNQSTIDNFFNQSGVLILYVTTTLQDFDPSTQKVTTYDKDNYFIINSETTLFLQLTYQLSEISVSDGFLFPTTRKITILSGVEMIAQTTPSSGLLITTLFQLNRLQRIKEIQYVQLTFVLAQIGSLFSVLLIVSYLIIFINQRRMYEQMTIEILKIYFPQLKTRKISYNVLGKVKQISGLEEFQWKEFLKDYQHLAIEKLSILAQLSQIAQLQWAIANLLPEKWLPLLKYQGMKLENVTKNKKPLQLEKEELVKVGPMNLEETNNKDSENQSQQHSFRKEENNLNVLTIFGSEIGITDETIFEQDKFISIMPISRTVMLDKDKFLSYLVYPNNQRIEELEILS